MPTTVEFEAGTIADCVKRAARVAPSKVGSAFDKSAGTIFDIDPGGETPVVVRATDTEVYYIEVVDSLSATGAPMRWRLPSMVLGNVVGNMATGSGKTTLFHYDETKEPGRLKISSGRTRITLGLNFNTNYPEWDPADSVKLTPAVNFGSNITRVEWAASKAGPAPLNGVHINGTHIVATDRYRIARVPCEIDLPDGPITIPAFSIGSLIKPTGDVLVGMDGGMLVVMTDDYTQVKTVRMGDKFAPVEKVIDTPFAEEAVIPREMLVTKIQNASQFAGADRAPIMSVFIGRGEIAVMLENHEVGTYGDVIELPGQADHARVKITFTPKMLLDALAHASGAMVTFKYNPEATNRPVCIDDGTGYEVWIAPRGDKRE